MSNLKPGITVLAVSYWSDHVFLKTMLTSVIEKSSGNYNLKFLICDNTNGQDNALYETIRAIGLEDICTILPREQKTRLASPEHAAGLNYLFSQADTEYCLIIDPDCIVLLKNWDHLCVKLLSEQTVAVGATYPISLVGECHGFPVVYFMLFKTQIFRQLDVHWSAYSQPRLTRYKDGVTHILAEWIFQWGESIYGRPFYFTRVANWISKITDCTRKDTGWEIRDLVKRNGYEGVVFSGALLLSQLHPVCSGIQEAIQIMDDFQLFVWKGIPVVTHFLSRTGMRTTPLIQQWQELSGSIAKQLEGIDPAIIKSVIDIE